MNTDFNDDEDRFSIFSKAYEKSYIKEDDKERIARERKEYDNMLLQPRKKSSKKDMLSTYDLMLMGWKTK